jgi:serine-type D-Ala-D-Ala carboxypeptidase (penicillin-binding protein 5/6)
VGRRRPFAALIAVCLVLGAPTAGVAQTGSSPGSNAGPAPVEAPVQAPQAGPQVAAASAILVDASDGRVLWEHNAQARRSIASTTKILTALVVIEKTLPDELVTASAAAEQVGNDDPLVTQLQLTTGEKLTVEQLLYGLLLPSASDAAVALAEYVGGSIPGFAKLMNDRAQKAGATHSHFTNPAGFDDPEHYSTAADMALIARAAMSKPLFRKIVATTSYSIPWPGHPGPRVVVNRNQLLAQFPGANGIKTGNTRAAGQCLVASATQGGESRISVVLDSPDVFGDSRQVLSYGFTGFRRVVVARKLQPWGAITYGDGTTAQLVAQRNLNVLVASSGPDPASRYDPLTRRLLVRGPITEMVPLEVRCAGPPCRLPARGGNSALATVISLFAPVLSAFR